jgi:hypothetical protein
MAMEIILSKIKDEFVFLSTSFIITEKKDIGDKGM